LTLIQFIKYYKFLHFDSSNICWRLIFLQVHVKLIVWRQLLKQMTARWLLNGLVFIAYQNRAIKYPTALSLTCPHIPLFPRCVAWIWLLHKILTHSHMILTFLYVAQPGCLGANSPLSKDDRGGKKPRVQRWLTCCFACTPECSASVSYSLTPENLMSGR